MKKALPALLLLVGCSEVAMPPLDAASDAPGGADVRDGASPDGGCAEGRGCAPGSRCVEGRCVAGCGADGDCDVGQRCCDARCVDPSSNAAHCGACGTVCPGGPRIASSCEGGMCRARCEAAWADCDGERANGCEVELATAARHCGRCGNDCGVGACRAGRCASADCGAPQRGDCDGIVGNGCEADLAADPANCGACGRACPVGTVCAGGVCGVPLTRTCFDLHRVARSLPTGVYRIDPDALGPRPPLDVYCDMEADGGGWTYGAIVRTSTDAMGGARLLGVSPFGSPAARWADGEHSVDLTGLTFREVRIDNFTDRRSVQRAAATTLTWDATMYRSANGSPAKRVTLEGGFELRLGVAGTAGCDASRVNLPVCFTPATVSLGSVCDAGAEGFEGWAGAAASGRCGAPSCAVLFRDGSCTSYAGRVAVYGFALR